MCPCRRVSLANSRGEERRCVAFLRESYWSDGAAGLSGIGHFSVCRATPRLSFMTAMDGRDWSWLGVSKAILSTEPPRADVGPLGAAAVTTSVEESDGYERTVRGVEIQSVRTGRGHGPTTIASEVGADYVVSSVTTGFPMSNSTTVGDGLVAAIAIRRAPPGARWSGIDLKPGVIVYGPGADHTAVNPEGMSFEFATVPIDRLERLADGMHVELATPQAGDVVTLAPSLATARLHEMLATHIETTSKRPPSASGGSRLLASLTSALAHPRRSSRSPRLSSYVSRRIVRSCIEHAEATGYVPTIPELCLAVGTSERRLHRAFTETFGLPPSVYFRRWGLEAARNRLLATEQPVIGAVTTTAFELGFRHLGRFAAYYRQQYGELPSETVKQSPQRPGA